MYWINKIIWFWSSPAAICVASMIAGVFLLIENPRVCRRRNIGKWMTILPAMMLWLMATPIVNQAMQGITERRYEKIDIHVRPNSSLPVMMNMKSMEKYSRRRI